MAETKPEGEKSSKNKKINKMTSAEIDAKLDALKTNQGGLRSRYARGLQLRKKSLGQ
jgi:ribosomal protein L29